MLARRLNCLCLVCLTLAIPSWGAGAARGEEAATPPAPSHYVKILREKNIEPTADGLRAYFKSLHPGEAEKRREAQLIRDLGSSESFAKREDSTAQLLSLPLPPVEALNAAAAGSDPEVRWRSARILQAAVPESERLLYAALRVAEEKKPPGLMVELIRALPLCAKPHQVYALGEAMRAVARAEDADVLRETMKSQNVELRAAAVEAWGQVLGREAAEELHRLTDDPEDQVKLAAARALANMEDRGALAALVKLLSADELNTRVAAVVTLKALIGQDFAFVAYAAPDKRRAAIARWQDWLEREGRTAKLNLPLEPLQARDGYLNGNMLLAFGYSNNVVEYDPSGLAVWNYEAAGAWSAEKMQSGNVLIARYHGKVIQVDPAKNIVWEYDCNQPLNAKALANGNILIAEFGARRVIEVTPDKKVAWTYDATGAPTDVHRLENGNTLVSVEGAGCLEITPEGKTVWEYTSGNNFFYGCQPLPGGNVLVADMAGHVTEVTRDKEVVWQYDFSACDCFRLPNGNTLITGHIQFMEVTPDKQVLWTKSGYGYGSARR